MHYLKEELYALIKTDDRIFDFLQESALDGLWYWDLNAREHEWMNAQFWETLGYDPAQMPHLASAWQDIIHPDDLAAAIERFGQHLEDPAVPYDQVVRYRHQRGHTVYIRCRGMAIRDEHGTPLRLLGAHVDVSAEKQKELLLRRSQRMARIGSWTVNLQENTVYWDDIVREIHEVDPGFEPTTEMGLRFYKEGTSREMMTRFFRAAVERGEEYDTELQLVTAKGREIWVRAIGQPEMVDGVCARVVGVFQDIDDRRRNEDRVLNYAILEAKAREMEQFAYAASHDLREPLLTIQGYVDLLREDYADQLPTEVGEHLTTIRGATERMDDLMKGLLDYSRLSELKQLQEVDINEIIDGVLTDLAGLLKGLEAEFEYVDLPTIVGYPLELKLLFQNLISNAIRYRRRGVPPRVRIEWEKLSEGWQFRVSDNGIGMAEANLAKIFQLFRRLHNDADLGGTGIGLANCKKIVELHGGEIWATSVLGESSTFHFRILTGDTPPAAG